MALELNGTTGVQGNSGAFVAATAVNSTSGTSIDFTSIPSWVKRVTVMFDGVSTNSSSDFLLQLGTSSGVTTSGYSSQWWGSGINATSTSGLILSFNNSAYGFEGITVVNKINGNTWVNFGNFNITSAGNVGYQCVGKVGLSNVLDRVRITTVSGTATFDAGTINILYE